ncbi:MAG: arginine--tRNA ligase [Bacilli bacterium]|nr:arginine--tRNA ligase [Bacilli bacterium]
MDIKKILRNDVFEAFNKEILMEQISIEKPKNSEMGDLAVPCFVYSKILRKSPNLIADELANKLNKDNYEKVESVSGYVNVFFKKEIITNFVLEEIIDKQEKYGENETGKSKTIVIDYSSPNIAKPFGIGHLRSTSIGNAIKNISLKNGYKVVSVNHLGDWGTQFGKMIYAYTKWGNEQLVKENPITELSKLYVKFHEESEKDPTLEDEARAVFKRLEDKNEYEMSLWTWFREVSLIEFQKTYDLLGINEFDSYDGEAFYNDKMDVIVDELKNKKLLVTDQGAEVVYLDDMPPALIKRSDGASLYITRDLATAFYRKKTYSFDESLYVVGNEQTLHFNQLKAVIKKMGYDFADNMHHINFGLMLQNGKKMSTRQGKSVKLHDVLLEAIDMAKTYIRDDVTNIDELSKQVGIGAVIFADLKNYRTNDIEFSLEEVLKFEGETGPYVQYTNARIMSVLREKDLEKINLEDTKISDYIWNIIMKLYEYPEIVEKAKQSYDPSLIAKYAIDLAQNFNSFYGNEKIISEQKNQTNLNLLICKSVSIVLKESLRLLGVKAPEKM